MRDWEAVDCPACPSKAGFKCRTNNGHVAFTHTLRRERHREWCWRRREENIAVEQQFAEFNDQFSTVRKPRNV